MTISPMNNTNSMSNQQKSLDYTLFSWSKQGNLSPIHVERGEGINFYDKSGKKYMDFSSQLMSNNLGHSHPKVKEAIIKQMDKISFVTCSMTTEVGAN